MGAVDHVYAVGSATSTTTYDSVGRVDTVSDPKGSTTYGYGTDANGKAEHRGMPTSVEHATNGQTVTFTGAYDAAGRLVTQELPGGLTQSTTFDVVGDPTGLRYTGSGGQEWLAWTQTSDPGSDGVDDHDGGCRG